MTIVFPTYTVKTRHWLPKLLGAAATTIGRTVYVRSGIVPSAHGLAHEYGHVIHTHWLKYAWSHFWGTAYAHDEEQFADAYAYSHELDFVTDALTVARLG